MKYSKFLLLLIFVFGVNFSFSQSCDEQYPDPKPDWMEKKRPSDSKNFTFRWGRGDGKTLIDAKTAARNDIFQEIMLDHKSVIPKNQTTLCGTVKDGDPNAVVECRFYTEIINGVETVKEQKTIAEYWCRKGNKYTYTVIKAEPINEKANMTWPTAKTSKLPVVARSLLPGWQQIKDKNGWGGFFLGGFVLTAGGAVVSWQQSNSYYNQAVDTKNISERIGYLNKSDNWGKYRDGFLITTGVIYLCNFIQGVASGKSVTYFSELPEKQFNFYTGFNKNAFQAGLCYKLN